MRHICGISGGKDSTALALHLKRTRPELDVEYYFSDTGAELPGTYETVDKLEDVLGKPIARLKNDKDLFEMVIHKGGMLPSHWKRWCTKQLKIDPFLRWVKRDPCVMYVGIRADERKRVNTRNFQKNITVKYPLVEDGIDLQGVKDILKMEGIPMPSFYEFSSRSGCFMCFYQPNISWIKLAEHHPELYERAIDLENGIVETNDGVKHDVKKDNPDWTFFGLHQSDTLVELRNRKDGIIARHEKAMRRAAMREAQMELQFEDATFMTDGIQPSCPEVGWCDR